MPDMLVKLYDLPDNGALLERLRGEGITVKRAMTGDKQAIVDFVGHHFTDSWRNECETAFSPLPVHCYIAVKEGSVIGFACHDVVMKNFFGPTGVLDDYRGLGIGKALLLECLSAMRQNGYGYAIIGWVEDALPFYEKCVGAIAIPDSFPGVFRDMIKLG
ncbi:GCN5-like N-acetyltransferase [Paenibacillus sp. FSL R7-277]|uniref:GNAT family N-acetyltransferase n=1 Tax=Paenibacillus sp. FSL R7-277 TaxID=1227352 RepID=UPI0003E215E4|nr:GNAT family N-acetyltransferase [Paenibacillus sp. FSL R7-277]ETT72971.1 GCN5-like N-acetyltransferase [Paenibacillus sp. FSL R7-277]